MSKTTAAQQTGVASSGTPLEEMLGNIWGDVLGVREVGREDNFFELGGHSLLATRVISRIREVFKVELPLREIFEKPRLRELAEGIETIRSRGVSRVEAPLERSGRAGRMPLSFAQERLWFLNRLDPESSAYNVSGGVWLRGELQVGALEAGLQEMVRRHEVLRTRFSQTGGEPFAVILPEYEVALEVAEVGGADAEERERAVRQMAREQSCRPFDLEQGPALRVALLKPGGQEHLLVVTTHHILTDEWSHEIFFRELAALYDALAAGRPSPLRELPIQYVDFAVWQRNALQGEKLRQQMDYWKAELAGISAVLHLPSDQMRPAVQTQRGDRVRSRIPSAFLRPLKTFGQRETCTLFMTLLATFQALLWRYTGQEDIVVGSPVSNRVHHDTEKLIGFFVNTLVLRADFTADLSFRELLRQTRDTTLHAYENRDVPFEKLVEVLDPERSLSHTPLFQTMFVLQQSLPVIQSQDLIWIPMEMDEGATKFDLTVVAREEADGSLAVSFEYKADLLPAPMMERMAQHFRVLLEGIVTDPERRISALPLLTQPEFEQLVSKRLQTREGSGLADCVQEIFEGQVAKNPGAVALVFGEQQLTYGELNARANRLAGYLRKMQVGPEVLVGLLLDRSLQMVVAILGVLKAGGSYVPLDPEYPEKRLKYILANANVRLLLTESGMKWRIPWLGQERMVCLDEAQAALQKEEDSNWRTMVEPDNAAYVIYTSGSTGKPKGVMVSHRNVVRLFSETRKWFEFGERDTGILFHSYAFDFSVWEIWGALLHGGRLVVVPYWVSRTPEAFFSLLKNERVTVLNQTPSAFRQLSEAEEALGPENGTGLNLRLVIFGGEELEMSSLRPWFSRHGDGSPQLVNMYGITETTVHVTYKRLMERDILGTAGVIGGQIPDLQVYVLDHYMHLVPPGVTGELHVGGEGLARGYLNRPDLTAERFVPHPFARQEGERLYQTGDLARFREGGDLEYLGRKDQQVKLRGYRIELGEIEAALEEFEGVERAIVTAAVERSGEKRLVGYITAKDGYDLNTNELRGHLRERLPGYMVPAMLVQLPTLPLTAHGKVDRRALPEPEECDSEEKICPAGPRGVIEEILANIWADVLGTEQVQPKDNFFDLGGHSLLATRVISRIREALGVELPLRVLFEQSTLADLAQHIESASGSAPGFSLPPIEHVARDGEIPLSFAQQRLWFLSRLIGEKSALNIPIAIRLRGRLDAGLVESSLNEIIKRHELLRTRFVMQHSQPVQIIAGTQELTLPVVDLTELDGAVREGVAASLANDFVRQPFNIEQSPLLRAMVLKIGAADHVLAFAMHHIIFDGWSVGIFIRELISMYQSGLAGMASQLEPLAVQYADFSVWQKRWLTGSVLSEQLRYWKEQLSGTLPQLQLPVRRPRPLVPAYRGARKVVEIPLELSKAAQALSRAEGTTLFMTLLAAFKTMLYRHTGQEDIIVGTWIANRRRAELEHLIGFCANTLALRTRIAAEDTFRHLLEHVRETCLGAYAHQDIPFEYLVDKLSPERNSLGTPLFQIGFALQNAPMPVLDIPGLTVEPFETDTGRFMFDLVLNIVDSRPGLTAYAYYDRDLFTEDAVDLMLAHFQKVLREASVQPDGLLLQIPLYEHNDRPPSTQASPLFSALEGELFDFST